MAVEKWIAVRNRWRDGCFIVEHTGTGAIAKHFEYDPLVPGAGDQAREDAAECAEQLNSIDVLAEQSRRKEIRRDPRA